MNQPEEGVFRYSFGREGLVALRLTCWSGQKEIQATFTHGVDVIDI